VGHYIGGALHRVGQLWSHGGGGGGRGGRTSLGSVRVTDQAAGVNNLGGFKGGIPSVSGLRGMVGEYFNRGVGVVRGDGGGGGGGGGGNSVLREREAVRCVVRGHV